MSRNHEDLTPDLGLALKRARKAAGFSNAHKFLAAVKDDQGSAPSYSSYAQWESGEVEPRDGSLGVVQRFHEKRGSWTPVQTAPDLATALLALARELTALREERLALVDRVSDLEATVELLVAQGPVGSGTAARPVPAAPAQSAGSFDQ